MPPKGMILPIILGTPWQRKYKATWDWEINSILFRQEDKYVSQCFIPPNEDTNHTIQKQVVTSKGKQVVHVQVNQVGPYKSNPQLQASFSTPPTTKTKPRLM